MKKTILVIASNPQDTTSLRLDREQANSVNRELKDLAQVQDCEDVHH